MSELKSRLFLLLQKLLPRLALTALVFRLARIRTTGIKNFFIRQFVGIYKVNVEEVKQSVPDDFATFNDFFIRELVASARPIDAASESIVSPADGTVSAAGKIDRDRIFQAKGLHYTLTDLLATDIDDATRFVDGAFATIYLSPSDYHRVHSPVSGELIAARYVPGDLFSVNEATVAYLPNLFTRNERLICHLQTVNGPIVVILVGALNVGSINTRWSGDLRPRKKGVVDNIDIATKGESTQLKKGDLIGWFNMGSTVIVLLPPGSSDELSTLKTGSRVRMGQAIGSMKKV
ncbi:MAG: phosphatidylserine decarboxylase [Gammaproteobacteria bacterium]|nr:MAG: phosphatidylserine decarboxylase [Gammaproteobacteria bacterium]RLA35595.1 MAG: phosphatidylserine decarboxylase [Gammaproteobacteria bacterium]